MEANSKYFAIPLVSLWLVDIKGEDNYYERKNLRHTFFEDLLSCLTRFQHKILTSKPILGHAHGHFLCTWTCLLLRCLVVKHELQVACSGMLANRATGCLPASIRTIAALR
jgi:hypothetical protein